jgi:zinc/manganese transport system substrate-binding protein
MVEAGVLRRTGWARMLSHMQIRTIIAIVTAVACALVLSGCGGGGSAGKVGVGSRVSVVAAENVYGDIASQIGGSHVSVSSILTDPDADPHLFAPGSASGLAVARAKVVIQNGLGYDAFMAKLESASPSKSRIVVSMADALEVHGADANPHLWYDVPRLDRMASAIAAALTRADPHDGASYRTGLRRFERSLVALRAEVAALRSRYAGVPVAYTEPVPGYLLEAAGLRNLAPVGFTRAVEEGSEPSPTAVAAMDALVAKHRIRVLLYNEQAVSPITKSLADAARRAGVGIVPVTETLPPHLTFQQWQLHQAKQLAAALAK